MKKNVKDCQVFSFAGFTVIPTTRLSAEDTPALTALIGTGVGMPGGWYARKNLYGKYDIVQFGGGVLESNLSYGKMKEYRKNNRNRQLGEITDLFDNILIFEPGRGGYRPYMEDEPAKEDMIACDYAQILHDNREHYGGESDHDFTISDVLEKARIELEFIYRNGLKSITEINSEREEREKNYGYTNEEMREMEEQENCEHFFSHFVNGIGVTE